MSGVKTLSPVDQAMVLMSVQILEDERADQEKVIGKAAAAVRVFHPDEPNVLAEIVPVAFQRLSQQGGAQEENARAVLGRAAMMLGFESVDELRDEVKKQLDEALTSVKKAAAPPPPSAMTELTIDEIKEIQKLLAEKLPPMPSLAERKQIEADLAVQKAVARIDAIVGQPETKSALRRFAEVERFNTMRRDLGLASPPRAHAFVISGHLQSGGTEAVDALSELLRTLEITAETTSMQVTLSPKLTQAHLEDIAARGAGKLVVVRGAAEAPDALRALLTALPPQTQTAWALVGERAELEQAFVSHADLSRMLATLPPQQSLSLKRYTVDELVAVFAERCAASEFASSPEVLNALRKRLEGEDSPDTAKVDDIFLDAVTRRMPERLAGRGKLPASALKQLVPEDVA